VKPRTFANLESLCAEAERLCRAQGKRPPGREVLREWLAPCARSVTRAKRLAERAARLQARAGRLSRDSAAALDSVAMVAEAWRETASPAGPYRVPFDPSRHAVRLVELPPPEPAGEAL
jgi:hypothetical protein